MSQMITEDPMPVFVIKAKDALALAAVEEYRSLCALAGLDEQARQVDVALDEIRAWQHRHPELIQQPDHAHVPVVGSQESTGAAE